MALFYGQPEAYFKCLDSAQLVTPSNDAFGNYDARTLKKYSSIVWERNFVLGIEISESSTLIRIIYRLFIFGKKKRIFSLLHKFNDLSP